MPEKKKKKLFGTSIKARIKACLITQLITWLYKVHYHMNWETQF